MSDVLETTPVHFHDCPALGPNTRLPRALLANRNGEDVLGYHHKCPMWGQTAGEFEPGPGITVNLDGSYTVDTRLAEKLI